MLQVLPPEALLPLLLLTLAALPIVLFFRQHLGRSDVAAEVGVVGLGVMGSQLCLNLAEKMGSAVAGFDRDEDKVAGMRDAAQREGGLPVVPTTSLPEFIASLKRPRKILLLVPAGPAVDAVIAALKPRLSKGDLIVDMGNEWYAETERRSAALSKSGLLYMGCGTSGGESGARHGPCLMPGGAMEGWQLLQPIFEKIAAKASAPAAEEAAARGEEGLRQRGAPVNGAAGAAAAAAATTTYPCVRYIGPGGAGQYVKMVHNGIEYGDMQLIGEAAAFCRIVGGLSPPQLAALFAKFNRGVLESFLIEITAQIYLQPDERVAGGALVDAILDSTGSKGTGKWTIQQAAELGVPCATISAALEARYMSALKPQREQAAALAAAGAGGAGSGGGFMASKARKLPASEWEGCLEDALYCAKLCSYAQGMAQLQAASNSHSWQLRLADLATIWRGGCIIRARLLSLVQAAYEREPTLPNLLLDPEIAAQIGARAERWRRLVTLAVTHGVPVPALSGSLAYYDAMRAATLHSAQCVQAQRDFFGSHGFKRLDAEGTFHAKWG